MSARAALEAKYRKSAREQWRRLMIDADVILYGVDPELAEKRWPRTPAGTPLQTHPIAGPPMDDLAIRFQALSVSPRPFFPMMYLEGI